jgi:hypothetical protein
MPTFIERGFIGRSALHVAAAAFFLALGVVWSFPLATHFTTHLSGDPGDNFAFLWNSWWMREALASPSLEFFQTDRLFAPYGIDLTLNTHTALPSWVAATVLGGLPTLAAQNAVNLASLALNGFAAYLLAWDRTNDRAAAIVAGIVFGGSPYIAAHLLGHFNLICAWGLPLFLLAFLRALEGRGMISAIGAGLWLVATAFTDYYYFLYCAVLGAAIVCARVWPLRARVQPLPIPRVLASVLAVLLAIDVALVIGIVMSGGFVTSLAGVRIVATRPTNPMAFGWLLLVIFAVARYRPRVQRLPTVAGEAGRLLRRVAPAVIVAAIGILPLVVRGWALMRSGDYVAPTPSWRSGPAGVDLLTLLLGNPMHPLSGAWTRDIYARLAIDRVESVGWIGVAPVAVVLWAALRLRGDAELRRWLAVGAAFFVWALGPWLHVAGFDTGLLLPQNLFSFVPVLSNARMPGRAMVVVFLAAALIAAVALARVPPVRRRTAAVVVAVLVLFDYLPAPFPLTRVDAPDLYVRLREMPAGIVCELPMGVRDGFGEAGAFDGRVLTYQMVHGHPIVGGFSARVPESITVRYENTAVLRSLLRLSEGKAVDPRDEGLGDAEVAASLRAAGVAFVVLDRAKAPPALLDYVTSIPLQLIAKEGERELYAITSPERAPS